MTTSDTAQQILDAWKEVDGLDGLSYDDLVKTFADEIVSSKEFGDYQGDLVFHLRKGDDEGVLLVSFGSCSGCDSLQAAEGYASDAEEFEHQHLKDVVALRDQLAAEVKWASEGALAPRFEQDGDFSAWWFEEELRDYVIGLAREIDSRRTDSPG